MKDGCACNVARRKETVVRVTTETKKATLPLKYPYTITVSNPNEFQIVGAEGSYSGQAHLTEIHFGELDDPLQLTIRKDSISKSSVETTGTIKLVTVSQNIAFRFEEEGYKYFQDQNTEEWLSVYDERGSNRRFRLGKIDDPNSNLRTILEATPYDFTTQKEVLVKLPQKFASQGQLTKSCYTVLEHLHLIEKTGERRSMTIKRVAKQDAHR
jgi:hypothetical protein